MQTLGSLQKHFEVTHGEVSKAQQILQDMRERSYYLNEDFFDEEYESSSRLLESYLRSIYIKILFAYEYFGPQLSARQLQNDFGKLSNKLQGFYIDEFGYDARNEVLDILLRYLHALSQENEIQHASGSKDKEEILERILKNTSSIIYDRGIDPSNEAEVRASVFHVMKHSFPDAVREIPIPKSVQTYKPDLGVKSLKTAIEYKFADSENEVKTSIRGIFDDMQGYSGSLDWVNFYAVIYMTEAFYTEDQIRNDLNVVSAPKNWKFIVLVGRGARKVRKDKPKGPRS